MLKKIAEQFRKPAGLGGKIVSGLMEKGNRIACDKLLEKHYSVTNGRILEIGYGPGYGIQMVYSSNPERQIEGIDFSELMFKKCSLRHKKLITAGKLKLYHGDFLSFDFGEKKYDQIFCINVIYFWEELEKPFRKIFDLLNKEGTFCFYFSHKNDLNKLKFTKEEIFNKYDIEIVKEKLKLAGFDEVESIFDHGYFIKGIK